LQVYGSSFPSGRLEGVYVCAQAIVNEGAAQPHRLLDKRRSQRRLILAVSWRLRCFRRPTRWRALSLFDCLSELLLNAPRQLILPLGRDECVFAGHFQIAVAGDLGRLDGASADLLPPRDVRPPERVWSGSGEIASLRLCRLMGSIAHARIPQRLGTTVILLRSLPSTVMFYCKGDQNPSGDGQDQDTSMPNQEVGRVLIDAAELQYCHTQKTGEPAQRASKSASGERNPAPGQHPEQNSARNRHRRSCH
jgi:hypothetical protein